MNPLRELKLNQPGRIEPLGAPSRRGVDGTVRKISKEAILLELRDAVDVDAFQVGQRVTFKYWDVFGLHRGETLVTRVSNERPQELAVAPPDHVELTQKRKFYRVSVDVPVSLRIIHETQNHGELTEPWIRTHTEDLTPAGMRVPIESALPVGALADVIVDFASCTGDSTMPVETTARVVRVAPRTKPSGAPYTASLEFLGIQGGEQARISLVLFGLQRRVTD